MQASVLNYPSMTSKSDFFFCGTDGLGGPMAPPVVPAISDAQVSSLRSNIVRNATDTSAQASPGAACVAVAIAAAAAGRCTGTASGWLGCVAVGCCDAWVAWEGPSRLSNLQHHRQWLQHGKGAREGAQTYSTSSIKTHYVTADASNGRTGTVWASWPLAAAAAALIAAVR